MDNIYSKLSRIEKILKNADDITAYKIQVNTTENSYSLVKYEQERTNTNAIGFEMPNSRDEDIEEWLYDKR